MVDFKLLAENYKYCSEHERVDRDRVALDMIKYLCTRFYKGGLNNTLFVCCSFFSTLMYAECMEYLNTSGIKALCRVQVGSDRVIRIWLVQGETPLWSQPPAEQ